MNASATPPNRGEACASPLPSSGARHGLDGHDAAAGRLAFVAPGHQILGCPRYRLRSTDIPASSAFDPKGLYTQAYFEGGVPDGNDDYVGSEAFLARECAKRLEVIRSYQASGRPLEVGCATAAFLARRWHRATAGSMSEGPRRG